MLKVVILVLTLSVVLSAPKSGLYGVELFEIEPAENVAQAPQKYIARVKFEDDKTEWNKFKNIHGKSYTKYEEAYRFDVFKKNLAIIIKHNKEYNNNQHTYDLGINHLADMDFEDLRKRNGFKVSKSNPQEPDCSTFLTPTNLQLPASVDWREKGYVTPVKNQGQCGSCWSFSATGSLEGQTFKKTGKLVSLSEQQILDCDTKDDGCSGGLMDSAFRYIKKAGGIESEEEYPYHAVTDTCEVKKSKFVAEDTGCVDVKHGSERKLQEAVASTGPISIAIDAGHQSFQMYKSGVYNNPNCSSTELDHGVLAVGYGTTDDGDDYWIVKNSWGESWGEKGYIKMSRNKDNQCGIATSASYPLV